MFFLPFEILIERFMMEQEKGNIIDCSCNFVAYTHSKKLCQGGKMTVPDSRGQTATMEAILKERGMRYGNFETQAQISGGIKRIVFGNNPDLCEDQREALEIIAHKISRIVNGDPNYADSWRDIAGYATLIANRLEGK